MTTSAAAAPAVTCFCLSSGQRYFPPEWSMDGGRRMWSALCGFEPLPHEIIDAGAIKGADRGVMKLVGWPAADVALYLRLRHVTALCWDRVAGTGASFCLCIEPLPSEIIDAGAIKGGGRGVMKLVGLHAAVRPCHHMPQCAPATTCRSAPLPPHACPWTLVGARQTLLGAFQCAC
jgi:hypothetical protein